ncbi:MAG: M20/M25/M40 family metallo-hydrolase [Propionibacteriaceae bacterium]|jgi:acetylornithine deacetylase/succinyl-diaminopimelate desuccinylase-like protein|nr:M20/M25/M40 family metallo-hydrolase [Propionibacteriaceae bacterium]
MNDLSSKVAAALDATFDDYRAFVNIPSVSSQPEHAADVARTAETLAAWLRDLGGEVRVVREGGQPAVLAHFPAPAGKPTVCLYAHHDVQPTGELSQWTTPPFAAEERVGRLYGRGAADDKAGVMSHLAMLRAFDGKPPVGVKLFIEGEEECGSVSLLNVIERHREMLEADMFLIGDGGTWEVGTPALGTSLRGVVSAVFTVSTLSYGVHSGEYGGVVPDALTALVRLLATLHNDDGSVAIKGLVSRPGSVVDYPLDRLADEAAKLPGTEWIGNGSVTDRMWTQPACATLAIDTTSVANASNTLIPSATAKVSVRIAPGDNGKSALNALIEHLKTHVPWGAQLEFGELDSGDPCTVAADGPINTLYRAALSEAFGVSPVEMGTGGSIPMIADFQRAFPGVEIAVTGVCDPTSRMHSTDESASIADWRKYTHATALFLEKLGRSGQ